MISTSGTIRAATPPVEAVTESGQILYYKVRPDVFDSLNTWARQHDPLLKQVTAYDSPVTAYRRQISLLTEKSSLLQSQVDLANQKADVYHELWDMRRPSRLEEAWDHLKFPAGIVVGAVIVTQLYRFK